MKITLHGAADDVTGSAYLIETDRARVLVDFGLFQGGRNIGAKNVLPAKLDPKRLDAVLVTHAHLDHTGRLPLLLKGGFSGKIHATEATVDLAGLILRDSAKVQGYDAERTNRKLRRAGQPLIAPLYDAEDVKRTMACFRPVQSGQSFEVSGGISARYLGAGHMLGSSSIEVTVQEGGKKKVIVFSGDIGPSSFALIRAAQPPKHADLVFLESTYGDRDHRSLQDTLAEFRQIILHAVERKARILVPAFAVGRTQQIIYHLDELFCAGEVQPFPVYIDSPMAIEATRIYQSHPDLFDEETIDLQRACDIASRHDHVKPTPTPEESMKLNHVPGPCLIMAGSGMCTAGRILHHLRHGLWQPETSVVIVGYQGEGTLGRQLVDGAKSVKIFGETIQVKARIHTLSGFSAHAGQTELLQWFRLLARSKPQVVLTHGEARGRVPLAKLIRKKYGLQPLLPSQGDVIKL
ncbi:MAG: MBL fold metallo-hydrolase [Opitutaceae bacterium]|nr:MBL fold metallo-hydrolase [Opitutaceae bacterium]